jgi:hypothetical protein
LVPHRAAHRGAAVRPRRAGDRLRLRLICVPATMHGCARGIRHRHGTS